MAIQIIETKPQQSTGTVSEPDSTQVLKLIPSAEENADMNIYNDYARVQNVAREDSADELRYLIDIKEPAIINITDGGLSGNSDFNDFVSIRGINRDVKLNLTGKTYTSNSGSVMIENVNIRYINGASGSVKLIGKKFKDVYFDFDCADFEFEECEFEGVNYLKVEAGTPTFTNCIGGPIATNLDPITDVFGWFGLDTTKF